MESGWGLGGGGGRRDSFNTVVEALGLIGFLGSTLEQPIHKIDVRTKILIFIRSF